MMSDGQDCVRSNNIFQNGLLFKGKNGSCGIFSYRSGAVFEATTKWLWRRPTCQVRPKLCKNLLNPCENGGSSQTCPRGVPVPDDEDEEEDRPLHDRELGSCWGESHLAQGSLDDGVDVGVYSPVDHDHIFHKRVNFGNTTQGEVAVVKRTLIKMAFVVLVLLTLSMLHAPCTHFVEKLPLMSSPSSQI